MRAFVHFLAVAALLLSACAHTGRVDVVVDHDGDPDDLIAFSLLIKSGATRIHTIAVCPGDSYVDPATRATQLFVDQLGGHGISIAKGHSAGTNPFPDEWRKQAADVLSIRALAGKDPTNRNPVSSDDAAHHLAAVLSKGRFVVLETGPLTNIADALKIDPSIKRNITRMYVMGGAVRVAGNVEQKGHDGSAEWNFFNNPQAAADVVQSGIPITLVALDATNHVPLTKRFVDQLAKQPSVASQLAAQAWGLVLSVDGYYLWDTLTAAALLDRSVVTIQTMHIRVLTDGPSQGRTIEDPNGAPIEVAVSADQQRVEKMFLDILGRD